ncbi:MAG: carboxypeptidase-like regulatory domain-containing protein [Bacteroidales bacterium]|nr:carboxypeptidase-like regulatory domain-containing protein [Bacteroidales bacterium]MBN2756202.1 carboxypeptidase-like regulatory domain-containing protein [Bacteroidales bacterium]
MYKTKNKLKYINFTYLLFVLFFSANNLQAQDSILNQNFSFDIKKTTISNALKEIGNKINYYFAYDSKIINQDKETSLTVKNKSLKSCLNLLLNDSNLQYKVIDNHIIISKKINYIKNSETEKDSVSNTIYISAKVLDKNTNEPLQYASVSLQGYSIGTITNEQGEFILKIDKQLINNNICVSFLGYNNTCKKINEISNINSTIYLEENYISIQEIIIRHTEPKMLIKSAVDNIAKNYCTKPVYYTSFYREFVKRKNDFMFLSEAVFKVYKTSYTNSQSDQIKLLKSRKLNNISNLDTISLKLKSGLKSSLLLDIVKNKMEFIDEQYFNFYNYRMQDIVTFDDKTAYEIEFKAKEKLNQSLYNGNLYISVKDLAIIGAVFSISPKMLKETNSRFIVKKDKGLKTKILNAKYRVTYKKFDNKYYLNHVLANLKIKVKKRNSLFSINFETSFEMATMNFDTISVVKFKRNEISKLNTVFIDDITSYDKNFWENYNYIKPDEPLQEAIEKIKKIMKEK